MTALGHGVGIFLFAYVTILGISGVLELLPITETVIQLFSCICLLFIGTLMCLAKSDGNESLPVGEGGFILGIGLALANPKVILFFIGVFGPVIKPHLSLINRLLLSLMAGFIDALVYIFVSMLAGTIVGFLGTNTINTFSKFVGFSLLCISVNLAVSLI